jgi:tRNA-Thr(GGU) m(6)t(6)A37 methyltransferase TsaA
MSEKEYKLSPVGKVQAGPDGYVLKIFPKYRTALNGLDGFGHINVIWWSHYLDTAEYRRITESEQPYVHGPSSLGIFATRSPVRPNPICISTVAVLGVDIDKGLVIVPWMDAEDDTPILDIKPYHPSNDRVRDVHMPGWCRHWPQWYEDSAEFDWSSEFVNAH